MKDRLKQIRKDQHMTQDKFADELGVSLSNIKSYEAGRRNPSEAFLNLVCNKYCVNIEWLKNGTGDVYFHISREAEIAEITKSLLKEEDDFRAKLYRVLANLTDEQLDTLKYIADNLAKENSPDS